MKHELDLTTVADVVELMRSSRSKSEWNANCDRVKIANGGSYPGFWFVAIILSGVRAEFLNSVGGTTR